jgi:spore maturation protein CgeB
MKIFIVAPKTITKHRISKSSFRYDLAFWNFFLPLQALGHETYFFDTSALGNEELKSEIEKRKPDLLFCIMTGDSNYCPKEPWEAIIDETNKGRLITFNWFADDTWRFDNFSSQVCTNFHACSTPELACVEKYKDMGYDNITYATWHANSDLYSGLYPPKSNLLAFIGALHGDRSSYLNTITNSGIHVSYVDNASFEDMIWTYSNAKIGLNFSKNFNNGLSQMKCRMFEIPAAGSMLLTEYHENLENCYAIDKDIVTFRNSRELVEKLKYLNKNPTIVDRIAENGNKRFLEEHDSKVRLEKVVKWIQSL